MAGVDGRGARHVGGIWVPPPPPSPPRLAKGVHAPAQVDRWARAPPLAADAWGGSGSTSGRGRSPPRAGCARRDSCGQRRATPPGGDDLSAAGCDARLDRSEHI